MIKKYDWEVITESVDEFYVKLLEDYVPTLMIKEIIEEARRLNISFVGISINNIYPDRNDMFYTVFQNPIEVCELVNDYCDEYDMSIYFII